MSQTFTSDIVNLNVGGTRFSTSRQTLTCIQDSFFTSMLSGRVPTCRDEFNALFIDRDPKLFSIILNFLRTKELDLNGVDISVLRHEAEFYGITPLVKRLLLCEDLDRSLCGDVLFTGLITTPQNPSQPTSASTTATTSSSTSNTSTATSTAQGGSAGAANTAATSSQQQQQQPYATKFKSDIRPGNVMRMTTATTTTTTQQPQASMLHPNHTRNSSMDLLMTKKTHSRKSSYEILLQNNNNGNSPLAQQQQSQANPLLNQHVRNQSLDLKQIRTDLGILLSNNNLAQSSGQLFSGNNSATRDVNSLQVNIIAGHHNWIAVAHPHFVTCYKMKDGIGWQLMFQSPYIDEEIDRIAINAKHQPVQLAGNGAANTSPLINSSHHSNSTGGMASVAGGLSNLSGNLNQLHGSASAAASAGLFAMNSMNLNNNTLSSQISASNTPGTPNNLSSPPPAGHSIENTKMCAVLAVAFDSSIRLWLINDDTNTYQIGTFSLGTNVDHLFFIGSQLVAAKCTGKIGVWNSITQLWQIQDVTPITSFDTAGSFLLLGGQNGVIYYIDMQKFPLRIKDNDLLVTELYKDVSGDAITALSVYLTPKTSNTGNWIEIAYGTSAGNIRVIVQHPETVGHGPQLFQTFSVHRSSIVKVTLTEKYLVSVCAEYNHVRTWTVTRFRGMISTQPGSTPLASFKVVSIDAVDAAPSYTAGNDIGPFGDRDDHQVFVQKVVPYTDQLFVRLAATGKRICTIKSVDYSTITSFCVHECDGPSRLNSRPRRYLFTGHINGAIQLWDLTTALELKPSEQTALGGPNPVEFVRLLDQCDLASNSGYSTPTTNCLSPCPSICSYNGANGGQSSKYYNKNLLVSSTMGNMQAMSNILNTATTQNNLSNLLTNSGSLAGGSNNGLNTASCNDNDCESKQTTNS